jgi:hypothetical protein
MHACHKPAFMIVDSFGHYVAQAVHDHGPPVGHAMNIRLPYAD